MKTTKKSTSDINSAAVNTAVASSTPKSYSDLRSGVKKKEAVEIIENFKFPDTPFTIKQILLATGINHWYVGSYIKNNARVVGDAPKAPGERGKIAKLYAMNA